MGVQREIRSVVIHCSDSPDTRNIGFNDIDHWHQERGFKGVEVEFIGPDKIATQKRIYCGYHYIVKRNGSVDFGRPEWAIGAHCVNHNTHSIGICWAGVFAPAPEQMKALIQLTKSICLKYALPFHKVFGHRELQSVPTKTCPNIDMNIFRQKIRELLEGGPRGLI